METAITKKCQAQHLVSSLCSLGILDFFYAPGNRNSPLIQAIDAHPDTRVYSHFDERGLGFMALGHTQASNTPCVIIVTSGTAVLNLLPSVAESYHTHTPLIVITADRPFEMTHTGANQTIDQRQCFGNFVLKSIEINGHDNLSQQYYHHFLSLLIQEHTSFNRGPIHINMHFRKPLTSTTPPYSPSCSTLHEPKLSYNWQTFTKKHLSSKGIVVIGSLSADENTQVIVKVLRHLGWMIITDPQSSLRSSNLSTVSLPQYAAASLPSADVVLFLGERIVFEEKLKVFENSKVIHITPNRTTFNPSLLKTERYICKITHFCEGVFEFLPSFKQPPILKKLSICTLEEKLFDHLKNINCPLFVGNSLPIRACDRSFFPTNQIRIYTQRGCSGIDGNIAHCIGIAKKTPLVAVLGDLTFLHDISSLFYLKQNPLPITFIIVNNQGGKIFETLPNISHTKMFTVPHNHSMGFLHHLFPQRYLKISKVSQIAHPALIPKSPPLFIEIEA